MRDAVLPTDDSSKIGTGGHDDPNGYARLVSGQDEASALLEWAAAAWPHYAWAKAIVHQGAFHWVLVLPGELVARIAKDPFNASRLARRTAALAAVSRLFPVRTPCPLGEVVDADGRTGVLISFVAGEVRCSEVVSDLHDVADADLDAIVELLGRLASTPVPADVTAALSPVREWCGGVHWPEIVADHVVPYLPPGARATAAELVAAVEAMSPPQDRLVHGDFGLHNLMWQGQAISGLIDLDHVCVGDPAIDVAPLIGPIGLGRLRDRLDPALVTRAQQHRATLSLQVAAAGYLTSRPSLLQTGANNWARRWADGTLFGSP